jgi:hypothetical protein
MRRKIRTKKSRLLDALESDGKVSLGAAAELLYDHDTELDQLRVVRLLAAYRCTCSDFFYHVRDGEIVNIPS